MTERNTSLPPAMKTRGPIRPSIRPSRRKSRVSQRPEAKTGALGGVLRVSPGNMLRLRWNPFYSYLEERALAFLETKRSH